MLKKHFANGTLVVTPSTKESWAIVEKHIGICNVYALPVANQK